MTKLIEDYALIGNNATAALVGNDGSIDWVGFPRFDSQACMAALLGTVDNGRWVVSPKAEHPVVKRRYRPGRLVLETEFTTPEGVAVVVDCMDRRGETHDILRVVRGVRGSVPMQMELVLRFDYGTVVPWVSRDDENRLHAVAGPERVLLHAPVELCGEDLRTRASFNVFEVEEI